MTTTWETQCKICSDKIYYYPAKLLLESNKPYSVDMTKRIVTIKCACKNTGDYEFPTLFSQIN